MITVAIMRNIYRYNIRWYMCPIYVQKLILILLQRKAKEFHLSYAGMFIASYEYLAMVKISN